MIVLSVALGCVVAVLLLPTVSDLVSLCRVLFTGPIRPAQSPRQAPRLLFLVPAHDEELLIERCLASLERLRYPVGRRHVVVVADNCSDATATLARRAGVECLERRDLEHRGKPRAVAWAIERLPLASFDALVMVDADAEVEPGFAAALVRHAPLRGKAVQTYNDVSNPRESALTRMGAVFSASRCRVANALKHAAALNSPLANGMSLGSDVLATEGWRAFSICEDWELYAMLTERGVAIECCAGARIFSQEARTLRQSSGQRIRWAAGKLTVLATHWRSLLRSPRIGVRQKLDVLAELTALGPVVQLGLVLVLAPLTLMLGVPGASWIAALLLGSQLRMAVYTAIATAHVPEPGRTVMAFVFLPFYTVWRIGVQLAALRMLGARPWVRTERHVHP